jgi:TPP-dependent pyruvate/acetoin dehydrogenase alpha subunit
VSEERVALIEERVERLIEEAVEFAEASPQPSVEAYLEEVAAL